MTKKDVHVVPHKDGWAVKKEGNDRASSVHERKSDALEQGRKQAREDKVELIPHRKDGTIQNPSSYGNDPNPPKDKN